MRKSISIKHWKIVILDRKHQSGSVLSWKPWIDNQIWQDRKTVIKFWSRLALKMFCDPAKFGYQFMAFNFKRNHFDAYGPK